MIGLIILYAFFAFIILGCIWASIRQIKIMILFKKGRNPFKRICRKCGAHQDQYKWNTEGHDSFTWWEEVYPIGNNPKCKCHKYAEYHD